MTKLTGPGVQVELPGGEANQVHLRLLSGLLPQPGQLLRSGHETASHLPNSDSIAARQLLGSGLETASHLPTSGSIGARQLLRSGLETASHLPTVPQVL